MIEYVYSRAGVLDGAVHGPDRVKVEYVGGVAADAWLKPGAWRGYVTPQDGRAYDFVLGVPDTGEALIADVIGVEVDDKIITKGEPGDPGADSTVPGPANSLTIGSVTTGATGSAASATITGTAPAQTLNLTLPRGEQGIPGTATLPDTGWRKIELPATHVANVGHGLYVRRVGGTVYMTIAFQTASAGGNPSIWTTAPGFHPRFNWPVANANAASAPLVDTNGAPLTSRALTVSSNLSVNIYNADAGQARFAHLSYLADDLFPSTLPGTPA